MNLSNEVHKETKRKIEDGKLFLGRFTVPFKVYGDDGPLIVCVNGSMQTMSNWRAVIEVLLPNYRVLTFDFPGQLRASIEYGSAQLTLEEQVMVLQSVVNEVAPREQVGIVSSSWGGAPSLCYSSLYREKVKALLIGGFGAFASGKIIEVVKVGRKLLEDGEIEKAGRYLVESFGFTLSSTYQSKIACQFQKLREEDLEILVHHIEYFLSRNHIYEVVELDKISAETLVICGDADPIVSVDSARELALSIPKSELQIISGVGHFLHFEKRDLLHNYKVFLDRSLYKTKAG